jgi:hypothetical protein
MTGRRSPQDARALPMKLFHAPSDGCMAQISGSLRTPDPDASNGVIDVRNMLF